MTGKVKFILIAALLTSVTTFFLLNFAVGELLDILPTNKVNNDSWFNLEPKYLIGISLLTPFIWIVRLLDND